MLLEERAFPTHLPVCLYQNRLIDCQLVLLIIIHYYHYFCPDCFRLASGSLLKFQLALSTL